MQIKAINQLQISFRNQVWLSCTYTVNLVETKIVAINDNVFIFILQFIPQMNICASLDRFTKLEWVLMKG
jgi:hypothetical protein